MGWEVVGREELGTVAVDGEVEVDDYSYYYYEGLETRFAVNIQKVLEIQTSVVQELEGEVEVTVERTGWEEVRNMRDRMGAGMGTASSDWKDREWDKEGTRSRAAWEASHSWGKAGLRIGEEVVAG